MLTMSPPPKITLKPGESRLTFESVPWIKPDAHGNRDRLGDATRLFDSCDKSWSEAANQARAWRDRFVWKSKSALALYFEIIQRFCEEQERSEETRRWQNRKANNSRRERLIKESVACLKIASGLDTSEDHDTGNHLLKAVIPLIEEANNPPNYYPSEHSSELLNPILEILNENTGELLERCLKSLDESAKADYEAKRYRDMNETSAAAHALAEFSEAHKHTF